MATAPILQTNGGTSYTIVTHVIPSSTAQNTDHQNPGQNLSTLRQFLKGEPKALGTVQIMIGVLMILFGIVLAVNSTIISVFSGIVFWGALFHISAGSLAVSASNKLNSCAVKGALVLNIFSMIAAGTSILLMSIDLSIRHCRYYAGSFTCNSDFMSRTLGIIGVLVVFSLLQFCISFAVSIFTCKATCCTTEPTINMMHAMGGPPVEKPPVYCEKSQPDY